MIRQRVIAACWFPALLVLCTLLSLRLAFGSLDALAHGPIGDGSTAERLWIFWRCREDVLAALSGQGILAALNLALVQGYPFCGNILEYWTLSAPLAALMPFPQWWNVQALVILVVNAAATALLVRRACQSRAAASFAAVVMATNPWVLSVLQRSRPREALLAPVALFLLALHEATEQPRVPRLVLAGVALWFCALFYWFYALFGVMAVGILVAMRRLRVGSASLVLGVSLILSVPFILPYLTQGGERLPGTTFRVALLSYSEAMAMPPDVNWNRVSTGSLQDLFRDSASAEWILAGPARVRGGLPFILVALAVVGAWLTPKRGASWAVGALFFYVVSLGPNLRLHDAPWPSAGPLALPYRWMYTWVPFVSRLFHPDRAGAYVCLCLVTLAGLGLASVSQPRQRWAMAAGCAVSWLLPVFMLGAYPLVQEVVEVPAFYRDLATAPEGGLLEVPGAINHPDWSVSYYQTLHGRSVANGVGYTSPSPVLDTALLLALKPEGVRTQVELPADLRRTLRQAGVRFVVLHRYSLPDTALFESMARRLGASLGPPMREEWERPPFPMVPSSSRYPMRVWDLVRERAAKGG